MNLPPVDLPPLPQPDPFQDPIALAVVAEFCEAGEAAGVDGVLARAGVSAAEFSQRYGDLEECALDAYERFIADYERRIGMAFNSRSDWRSALRAAAYESADWMEENPGLVRFGTSEVLRMKNEGFRLRREEVFFHGAQLIARGRYVSETADESTAMIAVGSIAQLLTRRVQQGVPIAPHAMVPEIMYGVVRAYLGEEAAQEELVLPRLSNT